MIPRRKTIPYATTPAMGANKAIFTPLKKISHKSIKSAISIYIK
ncbi:hypothetical protein NitYY0826_C0204 [Nitratiruptor sp. YY08-26]|nr:hypothetical protein NitYY0813_C0204 [Nitratiruptor sp. YY08-13]BCD65298.1 hypothetical protein NitYY0826_C0204 [Nitratiruptor sp. YY08-26]